MAISHNEIQIQWGGSNNVSVASGGTETSDLIGPSDTALQAQLQLKADHDGTPSSGDTVEFWLLQTLGDPDGTGSDEFDTDEQSTIMAVLDTNEDDPALTTVRFPLPQKDGKLLAKNDGGSSITVSATLLEQTS